jgi:DNA (cytosine-5)-methyltransferase 1
LRQFETIAFVEKDEFCQKVLKKNFNNIPIESEVRNVKGDRYTADIITGGFPCQPFSVAGKRKGTDDDRYLWDETIRIIRETKPRWFIGENVEGIINIQEGVVLRQVCDDLEKEGFEVQCVVIPPSMSDAVGVGYIFTASGRGVPPCLYFFVLSDAESCVGVGYILIISDR